MIFTPGMNIDPYTILFQQKDLRFSLKFVWKGGPRKNKPQKHFSDTCYPIGFTSK